MRKTILLAAVSAVLLTTQASAQADSPPDISGFWGIDFGKITEDPVLGAKLPPDAVVIHDSGAPEFKRMEFGGLELTDSALEHARQWDPAQDLTLTRACMPPSIVYGIQGPFPFEIYQTPELIVFKYEYFDQFRLIFMDGRGHPGPDYPHSKMGHSIGHWEGDELVIDTTHIAASTITNNGLDHTDDVHMVERYRLSDDGKQLLATEWFSDPNVLKTDGARYISWVKNEGAYVYPYECDPSFALEYQDMSGN